jgi:hypothetical protein
VLLALAVHPRSDAADLLSQQGGTTIPLNAWTQVTPGGWPVKGTSYDSAQYVSVLGRHIWRGSYKNIGTEPNIAMLSFSYRENRFDVLGSWGMFSGYEHYPMQGHPVSQSVYMPVRNMILEYGEGSAANQSDRPLRTWWFDPISLTGRDKYTTPMLGTLQTKAMVYDQSRDLAFLWSDGLDGMARYTPSTNTWETDISTTGTAHPGVERPIGAYSTADRKIYFFGGAVSGGSCANYTFTNQITIFDPATDTWSTPSISGGPPTARMWHGWTYNTRENKFLMTGGKYCPGGVETGLTDTWQFDPVALTWTQLSPSAVYTWDVAFRVPDGRLTYDEDNNAYVVTFNTDSGMAVWILCTSGCANVGRESNTYTPTAGSLNNVSPSSSVQSYAHDAALAVGGSTLYAGWIETGTPSDTSNCQYHKPYVQAFTSGTWTDLFSGCLSMAPEPGGNPGFTDASALHMAWDGTALWATWEQNNNSGVLSNVQAKNWTSGTTWTGGLLPGTAFQGFNRIISVGSTPTAGVVHPLAGGGPSGTVSADLKIYEYSGSWAQKGTGEININSGSRIDSFALATDNTDVAVCFAETLLTSAFAVSTKPRVHCKEWSGSAWSELGSGVSTSGAWAADVDAIYVGSTLYVAYVERSAQTANPKLYVESWNGSAWSIVGGAAINLSQTNGWPFRPRLATDGTNLYVLFEEQANLAEPNRLHLAKWDTSEWTYPGGSPNMDTAYGSVAHASLVMYDSKPTALWGELTLGSLRQTYLRQFDGSTWTALTATEPGPSSRISGAARIGGAARIQ